MKNLKKVLALVLAMALSFTMFAGAVDFSDVKPGDDYSAAISMLSDLEVISGNGKGQYEPAKAVTRAEACVLIANMMNGGKADTARFAGGSNFSDVAKSFWGESAIAYCVQNGITYGVGGGKFAPAREITDAEFVAMMTRAMGYDTAANPLSFPYGNYTAAVNNGLLDNIPYAEGSACTKGECAQIIYDALFADYARLTANLNVVHGADDHDTCTLIEDVFGLVRASNEGEKSKCTSHYWVIVDADVCDEEDTIAAYAISDKGVVDTDVVEFECDVDVAALVGYKVVLWGDESHANSADWNIDTVKAVEIVEGQVAYDYNPTMDWEDDLDLDEVDEALGYTGDIDAENGNTYVLIDWDNDAEIDYIVATIRDYFEVDAITSKVVKFTSGMEDLDLDGETEIMIDGDVHDVTCEIPEDLEDGDIVEIVFEDCGYEEVATWTMSIVEPDAKEVTDIEVKKGTKSVYFDGEKLTEADKMFGSDDFDDLNEEDDETLWDVWQDANGYVIKLTESSETYKGVLFVRGQADGENTTGNRKNAVIDVTFEDGESEDDVVLNKDANVVNKYRVITEDLIGNAYKYQMNDDGEITKLTAVTDKTGATFFYDESQEKITIDRDSSKEYWMDKCTTIFAVKGGIDVTDTLYDVIDADDVKVYSYTDITRDIENAETNGVEYAVKTKTTNKFDTVAVMGVDNFRMFNDYSENIGLIYSVTYSTKNDNYTVKGYFAGEAGEVSYKTIDEDDMDAATVTGLANAVKDTTADTMVYALVEFNADGEITDFTALSAIQNNWMDIAAGDYEAGRVALNHLTSINSDLVVSKLVATGVDTAAPQLSTNNTKDYKFADDAVFFVTSDKDDDNNKIPALTVGQILSAEDGFLTTDLTEYSAKKFVSYFNDNADKAEEYMVADVVLNDDDEVIMVVVFDEVLEAEAFSSKPVTKKWFDIKGADAGKQISFEMYEQTSQLKADGTTVTGDKKTLTQDEVAAFADSIVSVKIDRVKKDESNFGDNAVVDDDPVITGVQVTKHPENTKRSLIIPQGENCDLRVGDVITVTIAGYGVDTFTVTK